MSDDETARRDDRSREGRPLSDQERAERYREQLRELHVIDLVRDMMVTLVTVGYEKLGLTEQTRELRDLGDARVAIESLRRLIEVVEGEGDPDAGSLRSTLAQMQLNFARASAEPRPAAAAPPAPAPAEAASTEPPAAEPPAKKPPAGKSTAAKPPAGKPPAGKSTSAKPAAGESPAKKAPAKKAPAKKAPTRKPAARKPTTSS